MAKPTDCAHCQKPATIHLTQIVDGKITKLDFCEDCPHQKEVSDPEAFSLAQMLASHAIEDQQAQASLASVCPQCGMTLRDFKRSGRFGCCGCYDAFRKVVEQMLPQMQSGDTHSGKHPAAMLERMANARRGTELRDALAVAVKEENYEQAARLRDELKQWESAAAALAAAAAVSSASAGAPTAAESRECGGCAKPGASGESAECVKSDNPANPDNPGKPMDSGEPDESGASDESSAR